MNEEQWMRDLARQARGEEVPEPDVTPSVLQQVRAESPTIDVPFTTIAVLSAAAAVITLFLVGESWFAWNDPFVTVFPSLDLLVE